MVPEAKSYIPNFLMCVACTKPPYMFTCVYNYQICAETSRHLESVKLNKTASWSIHNISGSYREAAHNTHRQVAATDLRSTHCIEICCFQRPTAKRNTNIYMYRLTGQARNTAAYRLLYTYHSNSLRFLSTACKGKLEQALICCCVSALSSCNCLSHLLLCELLQTVKPTATLLRLRKLYICA